MPAVMNEINLLDDHLRAIREVEQVYVEATHGSLSVLVVVPDKSVSVQQEIYSAEEKMI